MTLKILLVHNYYQQSGGEDTVFSAESALLRQRGHIVIEYSEHNERINSIKRLDVGVQAIWSHESYRRISALMARERPEIVHFHNTFPLISPSAYYACRAQGIPVVQTLHNYRLLCPAATFYRNGHVCEKCLGRSIPWRGVKHACYHDSHIQTAAVVAMLSLHRLVGTWRDKIDVYIVLTEFGRQKLIQGGLPAKKIAVKPNFVESDPGPGSHQGDFALFVGRLSPEKGIRMLLESWKSSGSVPLKLIGDGPMRELLDQNIQDHTRINVLGKLERAELLALMKEARFLVLPSEWFEGFPVTIGEAFACGLPVIASNLGAAGEIVADGITGLHFTPGDVQNLASKVQWAWEHPQEMAEMGKNARREYEAKYTAEKNYDILMDIYKRAIAENHAVR